jgi:general secretion pathway protein G
MGVIASSEPVDDLSVGTGVSIRPSGRLCPIAPQFTIRNSQFRGLTQRGFTLVELLVVIALISILAAMAVVQHRNSVQRGQEAVLKTNLFRMRDAIDQYYADKGKYPSSLDTLVSEQYIRRIPIDPFTNSADSWQTVPAEPDPANPSAEPGIYDVKSGAQGTALDGTNFADW